MNIPPPPINALVTALRLDVMKILKCWAIYVLKNLNQPFERFHNNKNICLQNVTDVGEVASGRNLSVDWGGWLFIYPCFIQLISKEIHDLTDFRRN